VAKWDHKRKIMRRYNLTARLYDMRYNDEQEAKYKASLETVRLASGNLVLDVGCGTGAFFKHAAFGVKEVVGVDISRELLFSAKVEAKGLGNVHLVLADVDNLPFRGAVFDLVFMFTVLQNVPKPVETLKEVRQVLARGGSIVVTGLKGAFSLDVFKGFLHGAHLRVVSMRVDDGLKCYVAFCLAG
jgi:ubiquinone/menaquinone biosynthesis C-methylase UbiE